jgi:tRNA(fMet)-specific endonuclease VapC
MPRFMLDTDTCSYIMKRSHANVLSRLASTSVEDVCISVITQSELAYGVEVSPRKKQDDAALQGLLRYLDVLDFPAKASSHYASIRAALKHRGEMIGANDLFIAAHARSLNLTLVTNNVREFRHVRGLALENWTLDR